MATKKACCSGQDMTDCIRKKAQELWEKGGRQQGKDEEYWLKAEKLVKAKK